MDDGAESDDPLNMIEEEQVAFFSSLIRFLHICVINACPHEYVIFDLKIMCRKKVKMRLVRDENLNWSIYPQLRRFLPPQNFLSGETLYAETCIPQPKRIFTTWVRRRRCSPKLLKQGGENQAP